MLGQELENELESAIESAVESIARAEAPLSPGSLRRQS